MKTNFLLPSYFERIGWMLFIPSFILGFLFLFFDLEPAALNVKVFAVVGDSFLSNTYHFFTIGSNNIFDELVALTLIVSLIFIALSKEKVEDEFVSRIRLESLLWATYVNYAILILTILFVFDMAFFAVLVINMFTILLFFTIRFKWILYRSRKMAQNEK